MSYKILVNFSKKSPDISIENDVFKCYGGVCHGTLGELIQAPLLYNGKMEIAIISLPVQKFSWSHYTLGQEGEGPLEFSGRSKCKKAVIHYLSAHKCELPAGKWEFSSEIEQGRGMASSTADIVATLRCLDSIFARESSPEEIANILRLIERSDSVFLGSYTLYLSSLQKSVRTFKSNFEFYIFYIDEGYSVETDSITQSLISHYQSNFEDYSQNLALMISAFDRCDLNHIAQCATQSATLSQEIVPKRNFDAVLQSRKRLGADGIVVAHTGSLIGYIFVKKPTIEQIGELSAFFRQLGFQCRYEKAQF